MSLTHHLPSVLVVDADLDAIETARFAVWRSQLPCQFEWFDDAELANASLLTKALCRSKELPALILLALSPESTGIIIPRMCFP